MRISLYHVASALIAASIVLSSIAPASAAPIRMMGFGPGHVAHFQSPGFRPNVDHRFFAGDRFHHGHGGLLGADIGLYAPFLGDVGPDYGSFAAPGVVNSNVSRVSIVLGGGGGAPLADDSDLHGDCLFHKLIYSPDGRYIGQKTSRACY
jgi:hypothetical protein